MWNSSRCSMRQTLKAWTPAVNTLQGGQLLRCAHQLAHTFWHTSKKTIDQFIWNTQMYDTSFDARFWCPNKVKCRDVKLQMIGFEITKAWPEDAGKCLFAIEHLKLASKVRLHFIQVVGYEAKLMQRLCKGCSAKVRSGVQQTGFTLGEILIWVTSKIEDKSFALWL